MPGLALANRAGVRVRQRHQPVGITRSPAGLLVSLGQQLPGVGDRLGQLTRQSGKPPVIGSTAKRPAGMAATSRTCRRVDRASRATSPVSRSTSSIATPAPAHRAGQTVCQAGAGAFIGAYRSV
jgi:hypothetical protein